MSQADFATAAGVSPSAAWHWISGTREPAATNLPGVAAALKVSVEYLITGHERAAESVSGWGDEEKVAVPRLLKVAAGNPICHPMEDRRTILMDRKPLQRLVGPIPEAHPERVVYAADVKGESMSPGIQDGDVLIVRRYYPPTREAIKGGAAIVESGDLYLVAPDGDGDAQVKRLVLTSGHELLVLSDNPRFKPRSIDLREVGVIQHVVLGRPVKLLRDL